MKIRAFVLLLLPLLALSACGRYTSARSSSDYAGVLSREPLLIVPAKTEAYTVSMAGSERMYDYEEYVEPVIMDELAQALQAKGYRATVFHKADLMTDKRYVEYENFASAFDNKVVALYGEGPMAKKEIAENSSMYIDGKAKEFADKAMAPVLVYVHYNERVKTSGTEAAEFATNVLVAALTGYNPGSGPPDQASIRISIVDGRQDKLLWTNSGASVGGDLVDDMMHDNKEQSLNHVKKTIKTALAGLPDKDRLFEPQK